MFLFFSKILPPLIYPLGLSCILLTLTLVFWWKRPQWARGFIVAVITLLLFSSNAYLADAVTRSLELQHVPTALPQAEAIVVLGGSIKATLPPRPWIDVADSGDRVIYAAKLYREGKAPLIIASGGRIAWKGGGNQSESADMATFLEFMGVPASAIVQDPTSLNTYENAVNVKQILTEKRLNRILLITSAWHMPRSLMIFRKQGIDAIPAPTDFIVQQSTAGDRELAAILISILPDPEKLTQLTNAIKEYIGIGVYWLRGWL
jgi:uncharacterized SAM-binding protein YcdF (DUF218 family)